MATLFIPASDSSTVNLRESLINWRSVVRFFLFSGSLAASLLLDEGKLKRTLVGLNGVIFCWMSLAVSFSGPLWFNVVYLIKVIVPLIPMDHLLSFWS